MRIAPSFFFQRWMARWPTLASLAAAEPDQVRQKRNQKTGAAAKPRSEIGSETLTSLLPPFLALALGHSARCAPSGPASATTAAPSSS